MGQSGQNNNMFLGAIQICGWTEEETGEKRMGGNCRRDANLNPNAENRTSNWPQLLVLAGDPHRHDSSPLLWCLVLYCATCPTLSCSASTQWTPRCSSSVRLPWYVLAHAHGGQSYWAPNTAWWCVLWKGQLGGTCLWNPLGLTPQLVPLHQLPQALLPSLSPL